jgi:hypothetical protein
MFCLKFFLVLGQKPSRCTLISICLVAPSQREMTRHSKGTTGKGLKQAHQIGFKQASPKENQKQPSLFNAKQKECAHIVEVEEDPNGKH